MRPSSRKRTKERPAREHAVDRLGDGGVAREPWALGAHPRFERADQRNAPFPARGKALGGGEAVDLALDVEDGIDAFDLLQRDRRDRRGRLAPSGARRDVGKLEELPPRMAPAQRLDDRTGTPVRKVEAIVAVVGVGLQNAGVTGQMPLRMLASPIARGVEQRRRRVLAAERPVVADVGPLSPPAPSRTGGRHRRVTYGPINGERFLAYVEQFLVPTLKPSHIVMLDNLGSHKGKAVRSAIKVASRRQAP